MKCGNCKVKIGSEFTHAINNNQCPACGKSIMDKSKLTSFLSLRALLDGNIPDKDVDIDKIASLIVANFDIKQIFKDTDTDTPDNEESDDVVVEEEEEEDPDAEYKKRQLKKSKEVLKKMREEALSGALEERYGMGGDSDILIPDGDVNMYEITSREKQESKRDAILSGGGAFSRGEE